LGAKIENQYLFRHGGEDKKTPSAVENPDGSYKRRFCNLLMGQYVKVAERLIIEPNFTTTKPISMNRFLTIPLLSVFLISSCRYITGKQIKGNGNVITQARSFSGFTEVDVSSAIHLYVKQDSAFSVKVETDNNLQSYIIIVQEGSTLRIKQQNNASLDATGKIKVYVTAPLFKSLEASGACKIISENVLTSNDAVNVSVSGASDAELELRAPKVSAELTGASNMKLKGQTKDLFINGSGASNIKGYELLSENADVDVAGASSAEVFASVNLNADASGASDIRYKGNAAVIQQASGAGSVKKLD
jgi:hypothetical protein